LLLEDLEVPGNVRLIDDDFSDEVLGVF